MTRPALALTIAREATNDHGRAGCASLPEGSVGGAGPRGRVGAGERDGWPIARGDETSKRGPYEKQAPAATARRQKPPRSIRPSPTRLARSALRRHRARCAVSGDGVPDQTGTTFLRGLQPTDQAGKASFTTIYPGFYPGRVTHIHVEVHVAGKSVKVTQMAFPDAISAKVYTTPLYAAKGQNNVNNGNDGVFADGVEHELAELHGSTSQGFTASLTLGVAL
jgi:hypothetical protein